MQLWLGGHSPCAATARRYAESRAFQAQPSEPSLPPSPVVPSQPEAFPDMPADPSLNVAQRMPRLGQSEVPPPAAYVSPPVVSQLFTATTLVAAPHLPHLRFESLQALRRYSDPLLAIQSKTQELAFPNPPRSALGGIHLQSQMLLDPALYRGQRPLRRRLTAYVDIAVSRPGESHPEPLSEPYLNLSAHTAPAMEPRRTQICQCAHNFGSRLEIRATQCVALRK